MSLPLQHPVVRANFPRTPPGGHKISWRERLQALLHLPKLLRMVWESNPRYAVGILVLRVARSAVPLAVFWIGKLIVDEVVHAISAHQAADRSPGAGSRLIV